MPPPAQRFANAPSPNSGARSTEQRLFTYSPRVYGNTGPWTWGAPAGYPVGNGAPHATNHASAPRPTTTPPPPASASGQIRPLANGAQRAPNHASTSRPTTTPLPPSSAAPQHAMRAQGASTGTVFLLPPPGPLRAFAPATQGSRGVASASAVPGPSASIMPPSNAGSKSRKRKTFDDPPAPGRRAYVPAAAMNGANIASGHGADAPRASTDGNRPIRPMPKTAPSQRGPQLVNPFAYPVAGGVMLGGPSGSQVPWQEVVPVLAPEVEDSYQRPRDPKRPRLDPETAPAAAKTSTLEPRVQTHSNAIPAPGAASTTMAGAPIASGRATQVAGRWLTEADVHSYLASGFDNSFLEPPTYGTRAGGITRADWDKGWARMEYGKTAAVAAYDFNF